MIQRKGRKEKEWDCYILTGESWVCVWMGGERRGELSVVDGEGGD